jgi:hypothetical protein
MGPMPNLRTAISLFLNPSRIQIRTQFMWVPVLLLLLGHSSIILDSSLSLSPAIIEEGSPLKQKIPIARTYSIHSSSKKTYSETHSKKNLKSKPIKLNQQEHDKTKKKKKRPTEEKTKTHSSMRPRSTSLKKKLSMQARNPDELRWR